MNDQESWQENYHLTIKLVLMCISLGLGCIFIFDSSWIRFLSSLFVLSGFGLLFMAHKLKKKYLQPSTQTQEE